MPLPVPSHQLLYGSNSNNNKETQQLATMDRIANNPEHYGTAPVAETNLSKRTFIVEPTAGVESARVFEQENLLQPPMTDYSRPPRLSRRERSYYCWYFDLTADTQHLLPRLERYANAYGARCSAFLDISVTHIVTDKSPTTIQALPMVQKMGTRIIALGDFLQKVLDSYARLGPDAAQIRPPLSPGLRRAAEEYTLHNGRNLSHLLAEERRALGGGASRTVSGAGRPLYNAAGAVPSAAAAANGARSASNQKLAGRIHHLANLHHNQTANQHQYQSAYHPFAAAGGGATGALSRIPRNHLSPHVVNCDVLGTVGDRLLASRSTVSKVLGTVQDRKVVYMAFEHPFLLLKEASETFAPVFKEYLPDMSGRCTFPMMYWLSPEFHCPWVIPRATNATPEQIVAASAAVIIPRADQISSRKHLKSLDAEKNQHGSLSCTSDGIFDLEFYWKRTKKEMDARIAAGPVVRNVGLAPLPVLSLSILNANSTGSSRTLKSNAKIVNQENQTAVNASKTAPNGRGDRTRPGFCECCYEKYSHLERHVALESHRTLARNGDYYRVVDRVIETLVRISNNDDVVTATQDSDCISTPADSEDVAFVCEKLAKDTTNKTSTTVAREATSHRAANSKRLMHEAITESTGSKRLSNDANLAHPSVMTKSAQQRTERRRSVRLLVAEQNHTTDANAVEETIRTYAQRSKLTNSQSTRTTSVKSIENLSAAINTQTSSAAAASGKAKITTNTHHNATLQLLQEDAVPIKEGCKQLGEIDLIEIGSDSPLYSSPSFKRRRTAANSSNNKHAIAAAHNIPLAETASANIVRSDKTATRIPRPFVL